jgi:hypothetical protein
MVLIAFITKDAITYAKKAAMSALLQQVNGERSLIHPMTATAKKHTTATLTETDLTCNGIID